MDEIRWKHICNISRLIEKKIVGIISEEELVTLEKWRLMSSENEYLYGKMLDMKLMSQEYKRRRMVDYERPKNDMRQRINRVIAQHRHKFFIWSSIATVSIAAIWCLVILFFKPVQQSPLPTQCMIAKTEIVAGSTKAFLTLSNGKKVTLNANSQGNMFAINRASTSKVLKKSKMNILATPRGGEFKVTLEDGTVVWLNAASQLCYPDSFSGNERRVRLIGEAYFHVAKNEKKPFFVETANQIVRVYGTEFDINSYNENKVVYTTLVTGKVSLYPANGSQTELVLTPGHQAQFSKSDASTSVRSVDTDVMTSWIHGMFVFEDQTLEQIMQALGRWYNFTFEFRSKTAASTIFMGSMSRYSDFDDVLKILEQSGDLKFVVNGRHVVIFTKQ